MKYSAHFDSREFKNLSVGEMLRRHTGWCLEQLRKRLNRRLDGYNGGEIVLIVTSGIRTPEENISCGGVPDSKHLLEFGGHAVDVVAKVKDTGEVISPGIVATEASGLWDYIKAFPTEGYTHLDHRVRYERLMKEEYERLQKEAISCDNCYLMQPAGEGTFGCVRDMPHVDDNGKDCPRFDHLTLCDDWVDTAPMKLEYIGRVRLKIRSIQDLEYMPTPGELDPEDDKEAEK